MDAWVILLPAFVMSVLLIVTHTYFGLHVLARGIIFVDLALAQIAALGASIAFLLGQDAHGLAAQAYALAATLVAAFAFTRLRRVRDKTLREVIIGCSYVVATAVSIVVLSRSSAGMDELKALLNGSILWVMWGDVARVAAIYGLLIVIHAVFRNQFLRLSFEGEGEGEGAFLWEFLFFATFAVVITVAVNVAGVLLVFAFLIIPAFSAVLLARRFLMRLLLGWGLAVIGTLAGLWVAFVADWPVGATLVSILGLLPILAVLLRHVFGVAAAPLATDRPAHSEDNDGS